MIKISDEKAARILNCLLEAKTIINQAQEESDNGNVCMDANLTEDCANLAEALLVSLENIVFD